MNSDHELSHPDHNLSAAHSERVKAVLIVMGASLLSLFVYRLTVNQSPEIAGSLAVTLFAACLWFSQILPLPVTSLLIPIGLTVTGVFDAKHAFTSFGNPVLFLILGGYALAVAVEVNGVGRWIANHIVKLAGESSLGLLIAFMGASALLSMLISNTATTALLLPVVLGVLAGRQVDENLYKVLLLGVAYAASIGGVATLTGSPPNAIAAGLLGLSFLQWASYGVPVSLCMLIVAIIILWFTFNPKQKKILIELGGQPAMSSKGRRTCVVLCMSLIFWLFGHRIAPIFHLPVELFSSASVAIIALALLVVLQCITWKELQQEIHWGVLILLGGGLALGKGLTQSGAADWLASLMTTNLTSVSLFVILILVVSIAIFATELISNTAVAAKLAPILIGVELQLGLDSASLVIPATIGTSMAFMLPVATPPNALVFDTEHIEQNDMLKTGIRLNIAGIVVITCLFYFGLI